MARFPRKFIDAAAPGSSQEKVSSQSDPKDDPKVVDPAENDKGIADPPKTAVAGTDDKHGKKRKDKQVVEVETDKSQESGGVRPSKRSRVTTNMVLPSRVTIDPKIRKTADQPSTLELPKKVERVAEITYRFLTGEQYAITSQMSAKAAHDIFPFFLIQTFDIFCKSMEHRDKLDEDARAWRKAEEAVRADAEKAKRVCREQQREVDDFKLKVAQYEGKIKQQQDIIDNQWREIVEKTDKITDLGGNCNLADLMQKNAEKARDEALKKMDEMFTQTQLDDAIDNAIDEAIESQIKICWYHVGRDFNYSMWTASAQAFVDEWEADPAKLEEKKLYLEGRAAAAVGPSEVRTEEGLVENAEAVDGVDEGEVIEKAGGDAKVDDSNAA